MVPHCAVGVGLVLVLALMHGAVKSVAVVKVVVPVMLKLFDMADRHAWHLLQGVAWQLPTLTHASRPVASSQAHESVAPSRLQNWLAVQLPSFLQCTQEREGTAAYISRVHPRAKECLISCLVPPKPHIPCFWCDVTDYPLEDRKPTCTGYH